jgi:hypothetical protein
MTWLPIIKYTGYWDVPRRIFLERNGVELALDCPFDEGMDDYADHYQVYQLPTGTIDRLQRRELTVDEAVGAGIAIGSVRVADVRFDETKRRLIDDSSVADLLAP